ncbi:MAG: dephospho-CoA kinase [Flavobacteriaceae bacterium]
MMVVGITGGIGSGKSTVTNYFKELENVVTYIADEEAKKLMNTSITLINAIKKEFGDQAYKNNILDSAYIANLVFKNKEQLKRLNAIVHPEVHRHFSKFIEANKGAIILYENAILFEIGSDRFCDIIITVYTNKKERISRVMNRDKSSEKEVLNRMANQWEDEKKIWLSNYIITNNSLKLLVPQIMNIHNILTEKLKYF